MSEMNVNVTPETPATTPAPQPVSEDGGTHTMKKSFFAKTGEKMKATGTWIKENWKTVAISALAGGALVYIGMQLAQTPQNTCATTPALPAGSTDVPAMPEMPVMPVMPKVESVQTPTNAPIETVPFGE